MKTQAAELQAKAGVLQTKIDEIERNTVALKAKIDEVERNASWEALSRKFEGIAYLTPGAGGYSVLRTNLGNLSVALANVRPYASGSKISLRLGNVLSAQINGVSATIEWGGLDEKGTADNANAKSKEVQFQKPLRPASWTTLDIVLDGVPPARLGFVRVSEVRHTGIQLLR